MPYVSIAGERIFYIHHPATRLEFPPLVLVHGAGGSHQHWGHQIRSIPNAVTYALDLPGHGRSSGTGCQTIEGYAHYVIEFMDALQLTRATIAGHSMGSAIALWMALHDPARVEALILVGSGAKLRVLPRILEGILKDFDTTIRFIVEKSYGKGATEETLRAGWQQMRSVSPITLHNDFAACDSFDVMDSLPRIYQPTLLITGTQDIMTPPKYATYLRDHIPAARLVLVEDAGHMVMIEKAKVVSDAIRDFLDTLFNPQRST